MAKFGIDVSQHNGTIDWEKVKSQIDFAILRIGWIGNKENHTIDTQFERNYNECKRLGIEVGAYVYNYCENSDTAKSGAKWCLKQLQNKEFELPIFLDMEDKQIENLSKDELTNIIYSFNYEIEKQGYRQGVYANLNWFKNKLDTEVIKKRSFTWIAHYVNSKNKYENEYNMWQNSSKRKNRRNRGKC